MHKQDEYVYRAKVNPARIFKSPMAVVEAKHINFADKVAILSAWEADERALLRAEDEGMSGGKHAHLHKVQAALHCLKSLDGSNGLFSFFSAATVTRPSHMRSNSCL